jgi:hypothetical protein
MIKYTYKGDELMNDKSTKLEIKEYIYQSDLKYFEIIDKLKNYGISTTTNAFTNKLNRDTVRYSEVKALADILDCEISWIPKTKVNPKILSEIKRNNLDINLFEGFISNIFELSNPLNKNIDNNLMILALLLKNKELNDSLVKIFQHLSANYKSLIQGIQFLDDKYELEKD